MPPIVLTISVEGDPEASIAALRRIVGGGNLSVQSPATAPPDDVLDAGLAAGVNDVLAPDVPPRYGQIWYSGGNGQNPYGSLPEMARPAQWNKQLCNELVSHMTEGAKRLVGVLVASGLDGMKRGALTTELDIEMDTIRTTQVSIGHSLRRVQRANGNISLPRPVEFHKNIDTYMLHPAFRAALEGGE